MNKHLLLIVLLIIGPMAAVAYEPEWGEISSDERLESLKSALVDYALDRGVSVNASTWLDNDGAIEESVYLVSSMQLESLRFNEVANDFGYPEPAIVQVPQGAAEHIRACGPSSNLKRRLFVKPSLIYSSFNSSTRLGQEATALMLEVIEGSRELKELALIQVQEEASKTLFSRYMTRAKLEAHNVDLRINIQVRRNNGLRLGTQALAEYRPTYHVVSLEMNAIENQEVFFSARTQVEMKLPNSHYQMPTFAANPGAQTELLSRVETLVSQFTDLLRCRTAANLRLVDGFGERRLNGGRDVGVALGQQFLLLPGSGTFSGMGLERATKSVALVAVDNVQDGYATVTALSGRLPEYGSKGFIAIPLNAVDFIKNRG